MLARELRRAENLENPNWVSVLTFPPESSLKKKVTPMARNWKGGGANVQQRRGRFVRYLAEKTTVPREKNVRWTAKNNSSPKRREIIFLLMKKGLIVQDIKRAINAVDSIHQHGRVCVTDLAGGCVAGRGHARTRAKTSNNHRGKRNKKEFEDNLPTHKDLMSLLDNHHRTICYAERSPGWPPSGRIHWDQLSIDLIQTLPSSMLTGGSHHGTLTVQCVDCFSTFALLGGRHVDIVNDIPLHTDG